MDIVQLIKQDHRKVKELFRRFQQGDGNGRQRIAEQIIEELSRHAAMEEQLVYPLLRARDEEHDDDVLEALEEHHVAKATLLELDNMKVGDERYEAKMTVLSESIKHHIEEEETGLLPRLTRLTTDDERANLAEAAIKAKEAAPNHPHPMAPDTPPGNVVAGLLAKVMDAGKDVARSVISPAKGRARARAKKKARSSRATTRSTRAARSRTSRSGRKRAHG